jgi:ABC-type antimicrobial peptide transport system permease subunit
MARQIEAAAPALRVRRSISLAAQIDNLTIRERLLAVLSGFFSVVALLLAGVGLYGVMHFAAVRRTREIGIRIALGARRGSVVRLMAREMSWPLLAGMAAGMAGGPALARYLASQLFGVSPTDFGSFVVPAVCILAAAAAATLPPAIRASGADPMAALRQE